MSEKFAIITGVSSGLGQATAELLLEKDYIVFGGSRTGSDIDDENFFDIKLDVSDENSVEDFYAVIAESTNQVDLLINNAGICFMAPIGETDSEMFLDHLQTNLYGPFLMLKKFEDFIIQGESHIINILSTAAKWGYPNVSAYNASKFGFDGFLKALKLEWEKYQVKMTNLYPGAIDTPLWDKMGSNFSRKKMLTTEDYIYVMETVVDAPQNLHFEDITFLHREGRL
jgi:NAD(P)-dependent dehydrogenase (short-subunit alcohol dehydrogenase family)